MNRLWRSVHSLCLPDGWTQHFWEHCSPHGLSHRTRPRSYWVIELQSQHKPAQLSRRHSAAPGRGLLQRRLVSWAARQQWCWCQHTGIVSVGYCWKKYATIKSFKSIFSPLWSRIKKERALCTWLQSMDASQAPRFWSKEVRFYKSQSQHPAVARWKNIDWTRLLHFT